MGLVLNVIGNIFSWVITLYCWVIFISAILHLARADPHSQLMDILNRLTYPAYLFIKRFVKTEFNGLEFAPLIIILVLQFINLTLVRFLLAFH
ncbi:MAG: YggT family protein [Helicobacter trogontum]|uniref:YggT family protein n=1 Tax=Helicobacter trogontum TaxID=50960 RepID=UPI0024308CC0|nr:YggT family protein [Helicobacter trogontum]MCI5786353.1 YggT family protein [Helicobacter trogontum]